MKAAILCGGQGTRFRQVSELIPKPMAPLGDWPIVWHIMKIYATHGIRDFVLLLGYKGDVIRDYFTKNNDEGWNIELVDTGEKAMTGARVWRARKHLENEPSFCLTYGDGVCNIDLAALKKFHAGHGRIATLTGVHPPGRFGELTVKDGVVTAFNEKPERMTQYINGGYFIFNREVFDRYLNDREDLILEREPLQRMSTDGQLMMYPHETFWQHMDTPAEFDQLNNLWSSGKAPWKIWK
jgi:glucose-1-phosphate cytidylyltransferase